MSITLRRPKAKNSTTNCVSIATNRRCFPTKAASRNAGAIQFLEEGNSPQKLLLFKRLELR